jgi:hypothetical protein
MVPANDCAVLLTSFSSSSSSFFTFSLFAHSSFIFDVSEKGKVCGVAG